jgi:hypothetical protein
MSFAAKLKVQMHISPYLSNPYKIFIKKVTKFGPTSSVRAANPS